MLDLVQIRGILLRLFSQLQLHCKIFLLGIQLFRTCVDTTDLLCRLHLLGAVRPILADTTCISLLIQHLTLAWPCHALCAIRGVHGVHFGWVLSEFVTIFGRASLRLASTVKLEAGGS